jgi:hypothetical protein
VRRPGPVGTTALLRCQQPQRATVTGGEDVVRILRYPHALKGLSSRNRSASLTGAFATWTSGVQSERWRVAATTAAAGVRLARCHRSNHWASSLTHAAARPPHHC